MIRRLLLGVAACGLAVVAFLPAPARGQSSSGAATEGIRDPDVMNLYNSAVEMIGQGQYRDAIAALNQVILKDGSFPDAYLRKGDALKAMEDYQAAGNAYSRALEFNANSAEAYNGRGECYMEMSPPAYDLAINDFTNSLNLNRGNAQALSNMGHVLVESQQNPNDAIRYLNEALAINDQDGRAYRDRGLARALLREFDKALADLTKAVEVDGSDYENFATLASIHSYQEDYAAEIEDYTHAIETYKPKHMGEPEQFVRGYILRADARLKLAEKETDPAKRAAVLEDVLGDCDAVLAIYPDRYPESGYAMYRRGRAERMLERYSDAINSFKNAIQIVPAGQDIDYLSDAYLYRGICWYYIGSLPLARGDFEQASSLGGGFQDPRIFLWIGITYHKEGDYRRAIDAYSQAIAKSPGFALAHVNKGRAYMDLQEYDKAIASFNNAIRTEPDVGANYYNVGMANIKLENYERAVEFLNLALRQKDPTSDMYRAMAMALRGLGRDGLADEYERQAEHPGAAPPPPVTTGATSAPTASAPAVQ
jgi:tetratricopeptide (TPR) repeat protein